MLSPTRSPKAPRLALGLLLLLATGSVAACRATSTRHVPPPPEAVRIHQARIAAHDPASAPPPDRLNPWAADRLGWGDLRSAAGDLEAARAAWTSVEQALRDHGGRHDPAQLRGARLRLAWVGRHAPAIGALEALGGDPPTWDALRGRVVVTHSFWTYCNPCRDAMGHLNDLAARYGDRIEVFGLGAFSSLGKGGYALPGKDAGRIPTKPESIRSPVEYVEIANQDELREHFVAFREIARMRYPWIIQETGKFIVCQYPENHPIFLVDRKGVIRIALRGPDIESIEAALPAVLAEE